MKRHEVEIRRGIARRLRQQTEAMLQEWEERARETIAGDEDLSRSTLRDSLQPLLDNLANALEDTEWNYYAAKNVSMARTHGEQRFKLDRHGYEQVVDEYAELRRIVVRHVSSHVADCPSALEMIHSFFDASIKHASGMFAHLAHTEATGALSQELHDVIEQRNDVTDERDTIRAYARALEEEKQLRMQFILMLGHDMRAPLSAALLSAQALAQHAPQTDVAIARKTDRIIRSIKRVDEMIQNLLQADQLRGGNAYPIHVKPCNMGKIIDKIREDLTALHGNRFIIPACDGIVGHWDPVALQRLVQNLATNAIKYGSSTSSVRLALEHDGRMVQLSVHNQGNPIPTHVLAKIFEPRFRSEEAERSAQPGWGLGLAIVKAIACAHGGATWVESSHAEGTTFYVRLPLDCRDKTTESPRQDRTADAAADGAHS